MMQTETLEIYIEEREFEETFGKQKISEITDPQRVILGDSNGSNPASKVMEMLPAVIAKKMKEIIPNNFQVAEIELDIVFKGTVFGFGVQSKGKVKLKPQSADST